MMVTVSSLLSAVAIMKLANHVKNFTKSKNEMATVSNVVAEAQCACIAIDGRLRDAVPCDDTVSSLLSAGALKEREGVYLGGLSTLSRTSGGLAGTGGLDSTT